MQFHTLAALPRPFPSTAPRALRWLGTAALAGLLAACGGGDDATPQEMVQICRNQVNDTAEKLLNCVSNEGVQMHLDALARIARENGGSRAAGTPGYEASVRYVETALRDAGYQVTVQRFTHRGFDLFGSSVSVPGTPGEALVHDVPEFSGAGDVRAAVALPSHSLGCSPADYASFPRGAIALVERGICPFRDKVENAWAAGAAGVAIYNNEAGPLHAGLGEDFARPLPVVGLERATGQSLAQRVAGGSLVLHLKVDARTTEYASANVLAESPGGDPNEVVVAGAHLDSEKDTAGINDNGSGTAALLETALQMARTTPQNKLRFAFWGAEEVGLVGSRHYMDTLGAAERDRIALYLNFDMIASPNYVIEVYNNDGLPVEGQPARAPAGQAIQKVFTDFYAQRGVRWQQAQDIDGRSDQYAFENAGIPIGGITTGANRAKTAAEAAIWGGVAGMDYDACYHQPCDNMNNISYYALDLNSDALANAVLYFARNGVRH